jgi:hypothetical protein
MISRTLSQLVARISLREISGSSSAVTPAAFYSGAVSSKMRPFERAMVMLVMKNSGKQTGILPQSFHSRLLLSVIQATLSGARRLDGFT